MRKILLLAMLAWSMNAGATLNDCSSVYVGMIWVEKGAGLFGVTFHNSPTDTSGSNWQYFSSTHWTTEDLKAAMALLTAAKLSQHRVNVATYGPNDCGITTGWHYMKNVILAPVP